MGIRIERYLVMIATVMAALCCEAAGNKRIVAYVTSWGKTLPDPKLLTNINYAFGHVKDSFDGVRIDNPSRLKEVAALKKKNKKLQVQLSVGGWGSGNFSEMAADSEKRKAFARDCKRVVDEYGLDGIDIDWEYPGSSRAGISSSPADKANYLLLMKDLREAMGDKALLTLASPATVGFYEFKPLMPYVDFVNVMAYDLNRPPYHQSSLFRSSLSGDMTADEGIRAHISGGVPPEKLMLGVPFYGHGAKGLYPDYVNYDKLELKEGLKEKYDEQACVPYYADADGKLVMTFDNKRSLERKAEYVNANGLGGMMFWEADGDPDNHELTKAIKKTFKK